MKLRYNFFLQEVGDLYIAVTVGEDATRMSGFLTLNHPGAFLIEQLRTDKSRQQLLQAMMEEYDADEETLSEGLDMLLGYFNKCNILN